MTRLLAVDPGKHRSGWAVFQGGVLVECGYHDAHKLLRPVHTIVVEVPVVRRAGRSKGDPNDLIDVALAAGIWVGLNWGATVVRYKPEEWKGQVPKVVTAARASEVLGSEERKVCPALPKNERSLSANMWDAVALGLVHLGRLRMR